jgi:hypothetical protein
MLERFLAAWCRHMHNGAMWPMHGRYLCRQCLREHPIAWEDVPAEPVRHASRAVPAASASMDACA